MNSLQVGLLREQYQPKEQTPNLSSQEDLPELVLTTTASIPRTDEDPLPAPRRHYRPDATAVQETTKGSVDQTRDS